MSSAIKFPEEVSKDTINYLLSRRAYKTDKFELCKFDKPEDSLCSYYLDLGSSGIVVYTYTEHQFVVVNKESFKVIYNNCGMQIGGIDKFLIFNKIRNNIASEKNVEDNINIYFNIMFSSLLTAIADVYNTYKYLPGIEGEDVNILKMFVLIVIKDKRSFLPDDLDLDISKVQSYITAETCPFNTKVDMSFTLTARTYYNDTHGHGTIMCSKNEMFFICNRIETNDNGNIWRSKSKHTPLIMSLKLKPILSNLSDVSSRKFIIYNLVYAIMRLMFLDVRIMSRDADSVSLSDDDGHIADIVTIKLQTICSPKEAIDIIGSVYITSKYGEFIKKHVSIGYNESMLRVCNTMKSFKS